MSDSFNNDDDITQQANARDYFVIRSIYEIKQLQRDINTKMETLVNTFNAHIIEDTKNLGEVKISLTKLEEKDKVITKSAHLIWSGIVSGAVALGSAAVTHFLKKP